MPEDKPNNVEAMERTIAALRDERDQFKNQFVETKLASEQAAQRLAEMRAEIEKMQAQAKKFEGLDVDRLLEQEQQRKAEEESIRERAERQAKALEELERAKEQTVEELKAARVANEQQRLDNAIYQAYLRAGGKEDAYRLFDRAMLPYLQRSI
ncbi:MAG: hypothetical protein HC910_21920 [Spirulinaceae cyanobacterium SM2_1_0]|nr:hypothetical protein [Spirulinaceae cyanobacterium SM2_1_0]